MPHFTRMDKILSKVWHRHGGSALHVDCFEKEYKNLRQKANIKGIKCASKVKSNWKKEARKIKTYESKIK